MPMIDVSQKVFNYLTDRSNKGHDGDIDKFLYSHFGLDTQQELNDDRRILKLLELSTYKYASSARHKYELLLCALHKINPTLFASANNFRMRNSERILISNNSSKLEGSSNSLSIRELPGTDFFYLSGLNKKEYADAIYQLMQSELRYPITVAIPIRKSIEQDEEIDLIPL